MPLREVEYVWQMFRGIDTKDSPLKVPSQYARRANFIDLGLLGGLKKAKGPKFLDLTRSGDSGEQIVAIKEYIQTDGTKFLVAISDTGKLFKISYSDGKSTNITSGNITIASDAVPTMYTFGNLLIMGDGINIPFFVRGDVESDDVWALGTKFPGTACTTDLADPAAAGNLSAGDYTYRVTFESITGQESNPSAISNIVTIVTPGTNGKVDLEDIPINAQANRDIVKRHIYRTVANGLEHKFLATIGDNTTTIFLDNIADISLGAVVLEDRNLPLTGLIGFTEYNSSLYGFVKDTHNLLFSNINEPEAWGPFNTEPIREGDGDVITGLGRLNSLVVFKERSIHTWTGVPGLFRRVQKASGIGALSHASIKNVDLPSGGDVLFFLSRYGPYFFDEQDPFPIGREIEPIFTGGDLQYTFNANQGGLARAEYAPNDKKYFLAIPVNGSTNNNLLLVYDIYAQSWTLREPFYCGDLTLHTTDATGLQTIVGGDSRDTGAGSDTFIFTLEGGDDYLGTDLGGEYRTAWNDLDYPHKKLGKFVELDVVSQGDYPLIVDIFIDGSEVASIMLEANLDIGGFLWDAEDTLWDTAEFTSEAWQTVELGMQRLEFRFISLGFKTNVGSRPWEILGARIRFTPLPTAGDRK